VRALSLNHRAINATRPCGLNNWIQLFSPHGLVALIQLFSPQGLVAFIARCLRPRSHKNQFGDRGFNSECPWSGLQMGQPSFPVDESKVSVRSHLCGPGGRNF
jgi:hypothetical protein